MANYPVVLSLALTTALITAMADRPHAASNDPFSFFAQVVSVSPAERQRIDAGEVFVRILPAPDGEVAVFAASRLDGDADSLVQWTHAIEQLKRGRYLMAIRRFSDVPVLSDLDELALDDVDVEAIRRCRPGDCGVKLAANEIEAMTGAAARSGDWKSAVQAEFRRVILQRVKTHLAQGFNALPPYADRSTPASPGDAMTGILDRSPHLRQHFPAVSAGLVGPSRGDVPNMQSFLYWSKEHYGRGKPVISVTQVHIVRAAAPGLPSVVVLGQEIFASHYRDGSLGTTFVIETAESQRYLVYLNRSRLDPLDGMLGGLKRRLVQRTIGSELKTIIETVRQRIQSGEPTRSAWSLKMP